jgi:hypothetical protein
MEAELRALEKEARVKQVRKNTNLFVLAGRGKKI